jgi:hypothetical protein
MGYLLEIDLAVSVKAGRRWRTTAGVALNRGTPLVAGDTATGPRPAAVASRTSGTKICGGGGGGRLHIRWLLVESRAAWVMTASGGALCLGVEVFPTCCSTELTPSDISHEMRTVGSRGAKLSDRPAPPVPLDAVPLSPQRDNALPL